jgi:hypothetical protein
MFFACIEGTLPKKYRLAQMPISDHFGALFGTLTPWAVL